MPHLDCQQVARPLYGKSRHIFTIYLKTSPFSSFSKWPLTVFVSLLGPFNAFSSQWLSVLLKTTNLTISHIEHFARTSHCTWNKITNPQIWSTKLNMIWPLFTLTVSFHVIQYPVCKLQSQLISFSPEGMKILPTLGPSYTHAFTLSRYPPPLFIQLMSGFICISKFSLSGTFSEKSSLTHYLIGASLQSFTFIHSMFPNLYYRCFLH